MLACWYIYIYIYIFCVAKLAFHNNVVSKRCHFIANYNTQTIFNITHFTKTHLVPKITYYVNKSLTQIFTSALWKRRQLFMDIYLVARKLEKNNGNYGLEYLLCDFSMFLKLKVFFYCAWDNWAIDLEYDCVRFRLK